MKTPSHLALAVASLTLALALPAMADSKRTADFLLTTPEVFQGKEVTLDVAFVKPVRWTDALPEVAFFHALTIDRRDWKPAGTILVAVPADEAGAFAKKFGTNFEGRTDVDTLKGMFVVAPSRRPHKAWIIDQTGQLTNLLAARKLDVPSFPEARGLGMAMRPPR